MSFARQLLDTHPGTLNADAGVLAAVLGALSDCAQACLADADDDLREQDLTEMVKCIRLCWDCADVCTATLGVVSRQTAYDADVTRPLLSLHRHVQELRRRVREACAAPRALPSLRRCLPALRASLPRTPGSVVRPPNWGCITASPARRPGIFSRAHRRRTTDGRTFEAPYLLCADGPG